MEQEIGMLPPSGYIAANMIFCHAKALAVRLSSCFTKRMSCQEGLRPIQLLINQ